MTRPTPIPVSILGATGIVGQRLVRRLARHPGFAIKALAASEGKAGASYASACRWRLPGEPCAGLGHVPLVAPDPAVAGAPLVFSALDAASARSLEPRFAQAGAIVVSNASAFRLDADIPLVVPEVNPGHLDLLGAQRRSFGGPGAIVCNPNCTAAILALALAPLEREFGLEAVLMTSLQAVSGAGDGGVLGLDILGNVLPFIPGEESKVEAEIPKLFGTVDGQVLRAAPVVVSALCHRVPVRDGHTEAVSVRLRRPATPTEVEDALRDFRAPAPADSLPSAPRVPILLHADVDRPQPLVDVDRDDGAPVQVGRVRDCPVLGTKFTLLGHNAERGAALAAVLNAELLVAAGYLR